MELKEIVQEYKHKYQLSNKEVAEQFHVTHITVGRWLRGEVKTIQEETANRMSRVVGFDVQAMLQGKAITLRKPILGMAKAGYDLFLDEDYIGEEAVSMDEYREGDFFLQVVGDSMVQDGIIDGSLVYIRKCTSVQNGDIAVIAIGDEVTIKHFYKERKDIILKAANVNVPDRHFSKKEVSALPVRLIGKVLFAKTYTV